MLVVATTGGALPESLIAATPTNARIERFIPFTHLLPYVDIMVTNGGFNGLQMALARGIPIVAAGRTEDKTEVCARVEWSGVSINLKTKTPTPNQIKQAIRSLLTSQRYRDEAENLKVEMSRYDTERDRCDSVRATGSYKVTHCENLRPNLLFLLT